MGVITAQEEVLGEYLRRDEELAKGLEREAEQIFGSQFTARVVGVERGSVSLIIVLYADEQVTVVASEFSSRATIVFGERVRLRIRDACESRGFGVLVDVDVSGDLVEERVTPGGGPTRRPWEQIAPVLAAVATGIGILGFVAFVGGAIEFGRLHKAGLPAEEALAVLPRANLISTGAVALVPALIFALGAALLVSLLQLGAEARYRKLGRASAGGGAIYAGSTIGRLWRLLVEPGARGALVALAFTVVAVLAVGDPGKLSFAWAVVVYGLIGTAAAGLYAMVRRNVGYIWIGVAAFFAASFVAGTVRYGETKTDLEVRPAAVLRNGNPITGYFVAESSSEIYARGPCGPRLRPPRPIVTNLPRRQD